MAPALTSFNKIMIVLLALQQCCQASPHTIIQSSLISKRIISNQVIFVDDYNNQDDFMPSNFLFTLYEFQSPNSVTGASDCLWYTVTVCSTHLFVFHFSVEIVCKLQIC